MPLSDAELKELQELEATYGKARPQLDGLSDAEKVELEQLEKQYAAPAAPEAESFTEQDFPGVGAALGGLGRVLDYGSGIGRTAVGGALGLATGNEVVKDGDLLAALKGRAVPGEELLRRADVPEGPKANLMPEFKIPLTDIKLGEGKTSARDAAGLALEVGADPLTYATFGASGAAKTLLKPVSSVSEKVGETLFKSGVKRIDLEAAKYGKEPVSDLLLKEGIWGRASTIQAKMDELGAKLKVRRDAILQGATAKGGEVSMKNSMRQLEEEIAKIRASRDPELQKLANVFESKLEEYKKLDRVASNPYDNVAGQRGVTPVEASDMKTTAGANLPDSAYTNYAVNNKATQLAKKQQGGLRTETEKTVGQVLGPEAERELIQANDDLGKILTTREKQQMEAAIEGKKNLISSVDGAGLGYAVKDPVTGAAILAGKKLGDISKTAAFRTGAGLGLQRLGAGEITGPVMDILSRRVYSPWQSMETEKKNGR